MNRSDFIEKHKHFFGYHNKQKLTHMNDAVLVEFILNYRDLNAVKELIAALGFEKVA
jgi:adenylate cyclase class IV